MRERQAYVHLFSRFFFSASRLIGSFLLDVDRSFIFARQIDRFFCSKNGGLGGKLGGGWR